MANIDITSFTYSTQPHSAPTKKYRSSSTEGINEAALTLMSDPRVIRGSTLSLARKIAQSKAVTSKSQNTIPNKFEKSLNSSQLRNNGSSGQLPQPSYEFTVKPFSNKEIDVMQYLVSQHDDQVRKLTLDTQTDELIPRPDTPDYIPAKIGVDIGTQVENVNDLFDFNKEVIPILDVIVQKTLEQALFEVRSEEELKSLEIVGREYRKLKFEDDNWVRKREEQSIQDNFSRQTRIKELQKARDDEIKAKSNIASLAMMKQILPHMTEHIINQLYKKGIWDNHDEVSAKQHVIPDLLQQSNLYLAAHSSAQEVLNEILLSTESIYQSFPTYFPPGSPRSMVVVLTFKRISESDNGEDTTANNNNNNTINSNNNNNSTIMSVQVREEDSINSLDKRIRAEIRKLKKMTIEISDNNENITDNITDESSIIPTTNDNDADNNNTDVDNTSLIPPIVQSSTDVIPTNSVLPDSVALEPLSQLLHDHLLQSLNNTQLLVKSIVYDGILWNFPFPDTINIQINVA